MQIIQVYQTKRQKIKKKKKNQKTTMKVLEKIASLLRTRINHKDKF